KVTVGSMTPGSRRYKLLDYKGVARLTELMEADVPIHGVGNFPDLQISPSELIQMVCDRLECSGVKVKSVRLNGSAATHVLSDQAIPTYKDLDLIFAIEPPPEASLPTIKDTVMEILLELLPEGVMLGKMTNVVLGGAYVQKMVKVANEADKWSLISLNNNTGRNLELKFVQSMRRQFEFSVDSFQIVLDTYLAFRRAARGQPVEMTPSFHPTIVAESVYGDISAALRHLHHRRICTHRPEEIRGGGLMRYCNLLVRDFTPGDCDENGKTVSTFGPEMAARLEQHMCSRFFIDFSDIDRQQKKLISYLDNHFAGEDDLKFQYLLVLRRVVDSSTICLMQHERTMILNLITMLVRQTLANNQTPPVFFNPDSMVCYYQPADY
uniref:polynucleotide adenylyltransferase n=1 Tax=Ciona savignyi TaxID=51511 RepID=H2Z3D3_CIOSA